MNMNFVAMDFETANHQAHSACSLALVMVQNSQIVDEYYTSSNQKHHSSGGTSRSMVSTRKMSEMHPSFLMSGKESKSISNRTV